MTLDGFLLRAAPALFVLIWSTGWISAGYAAPHADALTFLTIRFSLAAMLLGLIAWAVRAPWPDTRTRWLHALAAGALLHGGYLTGVWVAIRMGLPAGVSGLLAALQPILTVIFAPWLLGERITLTRWVGTGFGLAGVTLVLAPKLVGVDAAILAAVAVPIIINIIGMISVTLGTFYQKTFGQTGDLRTLTAVQYVGAVLVTAPLMLAFEPMRITWNVQTTLTMLWSVVGLSLCGIGLLLWLIRRGEVSRAASLTYLVPPAVAVEAWILFGERLVPVQILGLMVAVFGVVLAIKRESPA
jgi:drug/metabolite transporter (DMT)-like permease